MDKKNQIALSKPNFSLTCACNLRSSGTNTEDDPAALVGRNHREQKPFVALV